MDAIDSARFEMGACGIGLHCLECGAMDMISRYLRVILERNGLHQKVKAESLR